MERLSTSAFAGSTVREVSGRQESNSGRPERNPAVDFTKGALVLCMVVYHSINYVLGAQVDLKYLAFLPPSFIFITGFLIAKVYLAKYQSSGFVVQRRLTLRGFKLLLIFTGLNLGASLVIGENYNRQSMGVDEFCDHAADIFVTGNGRFAIFEVLVPISYLLIISAVLVSCWRAGNWFLPTLCTVVFGGIMVLSRMGTSFEIPNLVAVGLLGMLFGRIPERWLNGCSRSLPIVLLAYGAYLWAVTVWNQVYWLQVVGVCLSVSLIYIIGEWGWKNPMSQQVILLGQYSLISYILQIALLQVLIRIWRRLGLEYGNLLFSIVVTCAVMLTVVQLLRFFRRTSRTTDACYRAVFG